MKAIILIGVIVASPALAQANHYVHGYTRSNGTYVAPHYQTDPNGTVMDNYSTRGNINPYTGQAGTVNPYASRPAQPHIGAALPQYRTSKPF